MTRLSENDFLTVTPPFRDSFSYFAAASTSSGPKRKRGRPRKSGSKADAPKAKDGEQIWVYDRAGTSTKPEWPYPASAPKYKPTAHDTRRLAFERFISPDILQIVVEETNKYAANPRTPKQTRARWTDIDRRLLLGFLGIVMYMGVVKLPARRMYWDVKQGLGIPEIYNCMSAERFEDIARCLHFETYSATAPKKGEVGYDKIRCIRRVVEMFRTACMGNWRMGQYVSVDEAMQKMKGKSPVRTYMPNKPVKYGYKFWCLCCATTGYLYNFELYQGKLTEAVETNLGANVVIRLVSILVAGTVVCCDRFFTSLLLVTELLKRGVRCVGTIMTNKKGFPHNLIISKSVAQKELSRGHVAVASQATKDGDIHVVRWMDNKPVYFISTSQSGKAETGSVSRMDKTNGTRISVSCADTVEEYQKFMGGVDHFDHFRASYTAKLKMKGKWYHYVWWWLVESALVNANITYNFNPHHKSEKQVKFRLELSKELMLLGAVQPRNNRFGAGHKVGDHPTRLTHRPMLFDLRDPIVNGGRAGKQERHDCVVCKAGGKRVMCNFICRECNVVLHPGYCAFHYHTVKNWKEGIKMGKIFLPRSAASKKAAAEGDDE